MDFHFIDFDRISKALRSSAEALGNELGQGVEQNAALQDAEDNFRQALSFGLSLPK